MYTLCRSLTYVLAILIVGLPLKVQALTVTTLNLEWFGRGGDIAGTEQDEYRAPTIREFMNAHLTTTDLFVLEEITSIEALRRLLPAWECRTYDPLNTKHQHVAACAKPGIHFEDSTIESVRLGQEGLRPAYKLLVTTRGGGKFEVIGVHLKAGKLDSETRLSQVRHLADSFAPAGPGQVPVLIVGDFNTFTPYPEGTGEDDAQKFDQVFAAKGFTQVGGTQPTYLGGSYGRTFDRVWIRGGTARDYTINGACSPVQDPQNRYAQRSFYTRFVSDHCPVSVTVGS